MESLRQASDSASGVVADAAQPSVSAASFVFEVVRHRGHWRVLHVGKYSLPHPSQEAAIGLAMKMALEREAAGHVATVRLLRTDGQIFELHPSSN